MNYIVALILAALISVNAQDRRPIDGTIFLYRGVDAFSSCDKPFNETAPTRLDLPISSDNKIVFNDEQKNQYGIEYLSIAPNAHPHLAMIVGYLPITIQFHGETCACIRKSPPVAENVTCVRNMYRVSYENERIKSYFNKTSKICLFRVWTLLSQKKKALFT